MKALEILKAFAAHHESAYGFNNILVASLGDITEALEELSSIEQRIEELSTPKTCDGCRYAVGEWGCNKQSEIECIRFDEAPDYYEPKEQK